MHSIHSQDVALQKPFTIKNKSSYNKTVVKFVATGPPSNHYFKGSNKVRDTFIESLLMKIFEKDFVGLQFQHHANKLIINYD